jgi:predicted nuclease of predicted toxin-antitoxin system
MQLKLDENMPRQLAEALRTAGHDVHTVADERLLGRSDEVVWNAAIREEWLRVTLDRDFGRLATGSIGHFGAIVLRPRDADQAMIIALARRAIALAMDVDMKNRVAIFEDERIRIRPPLTLITPQDRS